MRRLLSFFLGESLNFLRFFFFSSIIIILQHHLGLNQELICKDQMGKGLFDLEKHFAFYGAYHSNPTNALIHVISVWPIFFTSLILSHFYEPLITVALPQPLQFIANTHGGVLALNYGFVTALFYGLFYIAMDKTAGSLAAFLCLLCWLGAENVAAHLGYSASWKFVAAAQIFCWASQFVGQAAFEKRAPALIDNLAQASLMAPFFVLLEVLQNFGYEPYPGFREKVRLKIESNRKEWEEGKVKKAK